MKKNRSYYNPEPIFDTIPTGSSQTKILTNVRQVILKPARPVFRYQAKEKNICLTGRSRALEAVVFRYQAKEKNICLTGRSRALEAVVFRYQVALQ
jgi:hypothetical protein